MTASYEHPLKASSLVAYGSLALPLAFAGLPFYIHAPDFYLRSYGISLAAMGSLLLVIRLIDAFQDPLIGRYSDLFANRRLSIIGGSLFLLGLGFALLYNPPSSLTMPLVWFFGSMVVAAFAFSTLSINLNALGSLWSKDSREKTRITSAREGMGLIGLLMATLLPTLLQLTYTPSVAFRIYAGIFLSLIVITGFCFLRWTRNYVWVQNPPEESATSFSYMRFLRFFKSPFHWFFGAYALSMLSSSIPGVMVLLFIRDRLNAERMTGLFLAIYFLAGIVGMPVWRKISEYMGKEKTWICAMVVALSSFIWAYTLQSGDVLAYGVICFLSGLALGAELVLPPSILSDMIDHTSQGSYTSSIFSIMNFISKLALAVASGMSFLLLGFLGYTTGHTHDSSTLNALSMVYALLPCFIKAAAAVLVSVILSKRNQVLAGRPPSS